MKIKTTIKNIGKSFIALKREDEIIIGQSVLVIDNGYGWMGHLESAIETVKNSFPKADISVLTLPKRKAALQEEFPALKLILPSEKLKPKRYQIALQMLMLRRKEYDFIILFSLDITPLVVSMFFSGSKVVLYNQWGQRWSLRLRNVNEIFKVTYVRKKAQFSLKSLLKNIGLFLVLLRREDEKALGRSILIVDNGYALFGEIAYPIQQIKSYLPHSKISVLTLEQRQDLKNIFPDLDFIKPGRCLIRQYSIARHMLRLRNNGYDYIVLLSLDITPIIISILFVNSKVILCNRWHQWWSLKPKSIRGYLVIIPKFIYNIIIFIYLLISVLWILLKRSLNVFRFTLFKTGG